MRARHDRVWFCLLLVEKVRVRASTGGAFFGKGYHASSAKLVSSFGHPRPDAAETNIITFLSAKVRTSVLHFHGLTSLVKEIWFAEIKEKSLTPAGFEPTTSGVDHQRYQTKQNFLHRASKP